MHGGHSEPGKREKRMSPISVSCNGEKEIMGPLQIEGKKLALLWARRERVITRRNNCIFLRGDGSSSFQAMTERL